MGTEEKNVWNFYEPYSDSNSEVWDSIQKNPGPEGGAPGGGVGG